MFGNIQGFEEKFFFISQGVWDGIKIAYNKNLEQGDISFFGVCVCVHSGICPKCICDACVSCVCVCLMHAPVHTDWSQKRTLGVLFCHPLPCSPVAGSLTGTPVFFFFFWAGLSNPRFFLTFPRIWIQVSMFPQLTLFSSWDIFPIPGTIPYWSKLWESLYLHH